MRILNDAEFVELDEEEEEEEEDEEEEEEAGTRSRAGQGGELGTEMPSAARRAGASASLGGLAGQDGSTSGGLQGTTLSYNTAVALARGGQTRDQS